MQIIIRIPGRRRRYQKKAIAAFARFVRGLRQHQPRKRTGVAGVSTDYSARFFNVPSMRGEGVLHLHGLERECPFCEGDEIWFYCSVSTGAEIARHYNA